MVGIELWSNRLARLGDSLSQWIHLRTKDFLWLRARQDFQQQAPQLLRNHQWVFLVGCNNSGTTLIHDVLAGTDRFSFMPHEGQRYTEVLRRANRKGMERVWTEYLDELQLDESDSTSTVPRLLFDWLQEIDPPAKSRILEKTTANAVRMRWLQTAFPGAAFIGVIRNGYAVVEGIKRKGGKSADRGARHWKTVNEIMLEDAKQIERFIPVRYEDFVASPQQVLGQLAQFLNLPFEQLELAYEKIDSGDKKTAGSSILDQNALSMQRLTADELRTVNLEAGDLLAKLGYATQTQ